VRYFLLALRVFLGVVFLYAAYTKLSQPWMLFAMSVDAYQLLPEWAVLTVARTVPWLELVLGLLLISGFAVRYAAAGTSLLLGGFFAIMIRTYIKGMQIDCGCFGLGEKLSPMTLLRDGLLLAMCVALTLLTLRSRKRNTGPCPVHSAGHGPALPGS
jgi:uncharacterized membrane protein YphA (DoxX/SURF4 family)